MQNNNPGGNVDAVRAKVEAAAIGKPGEAIANQALLLFCIYGPAVSVLVATCLPSTV